MIRIDVKNNSEEAFNKACSLFKKACNKSGILKEVRDRQYYKKPSEIKREKKRQLKQQAYRNEN